MTPAPRTLADMLAGIARNERDAASAGLAMLPHERARLANLLHCIGELCRDLDPPPLPADLPAGVTSLAAVRAQRAELRRKTF